MKHFANFNNIGLGVGAAVGLARGSGLIGESQEERDNTTGLGRLGKLTGYTGGGAALGAGTGMAVNAGTKYLRGRKGTAPEPRPQDRITAAEPWDDDWSKPSPKPTRSREEITKSLEEKLAAMDKEMANSKPEPTLLSSLNGYSTHEIKYKPKGFLGMSTEDRRNKITDRTNDWLNEVQRPINGRFYGTAKENSQNFFPSSPRSERLEASRKLQNIALNELKNDIKRGDYSQPLTKLRNF